MLGRRARCLLHLGMLLLLQGVAVAAPALPAIFADGVSLTYRATVGGLALGRYTMSVDVIDDAYEVTSEARTTGFAGWLSRQEIREQAIGRFGERWNIPLRYERETRRGDRKYVEVVEMGGKPQAIRKGRVTRFRAEEGLLDPTGLFLQLIRDRATGEMRSSYRVVDGRGRPSTYHVRDAGQRLSVVLGKEMTLHGIQWVTRNRGRELTAWLAPELGWLPAEFLYTEKGVTFRVVLEQTSYQP